MNKELKDAVDLAICTTLCRDLDINWETKKNLHRNIQSAIWDYLHKKVANYDAALQSQMQETPSKDKINLTAREARSATCKARTCEGFIQNILEDIKYKAECGFTESRITAYQDEYKYHYFPELTQALVALKFDVVRFDKTVVGRHKTILTISW